MASVQPFQFEPEQIEREDENNQAVRSLDEDENNPSKEDARVGKDYWCLCGNCLPMATATESICCKELNFMAAAIHDSPCITVHQNFEAVCLNPDVLWAALVSLHDRYSAGLPSRNQVTNRSYRYASYRQFTWWMHGWLGRRVHRVIPSCAVNKIRTAYPEPSGRYTGFLDAASDHVEVDEAWRDFNAI